MPLYRTLSGLLLLPTLALADLPRFEPEPGLQAQVQRQGERYFLQQPDGSSLELTLPEGNDAEAPSFDIEDYDFDGHPDVAISVPAGMVNSAYHIYLYRPAKRRFERLQMPPALMARVNCSWLSELQPNNEERALYSHCRSGPRWYYDAYRFDESGAPWLYKTLHVNQGYDPDVPVFFPVFEKTLDPQGRIIASRALDDDDRPQTWTVPNARLYLHQRPDEASRTRAYLVEGDVCAVLEQQGNWLLIRYASRKGPLQRWVSLDEAYGLARP
ncbi:XAC2610-related protein [Ectopseudomonas guguanensis]|uniref:XAC2610-related protein n=1 Tax=Ectopseudomonas guguanensis TaxID=1198456 RepID=UPI00286DFE43|nr:hypothetical protein [Pseudomonas guguanensis]